MGSSISQNHQKLEGVQKMNNINKTVERVEGVEDGKIFSRTEVAKHSTMDSLWIIFNGKVCDLTNYLDLHPGGNALLRFAGKVS